MMYWLYTEFIYAERRRFARNSSYINGPSLSQPKTSPVNTISATSLMLRPEMKKVVTISVENIPGKKLLRDYGDHEQDNYEFEMAQSSAHEREQHLLSPAPILPVNIDFCDTTTSTMVIHFFCIFVFIAICFSYSPLTVLNQSLTVMILITW